MSFFLYILRCSGNSLYVGVTASLKERFIEHNSGTGSKFTKDNRPQEIVYIEEYPTLSETRKREYQLKGWSRAKKMALISGNKDLLVKLSKAKNQKCF